VKKIVICENKINAPSYEPSFKNDLKLNNLFNTAGDIWQNWYGWWKKESLLGSAKLAAKTCIPQRGT
jgi:hypothetical protein